jgi:hypothetical protein
MVSDAAKGLVLIDEIVNQTVQRTGTSRFAERDAVVIGGEIPPLTFRVSCLETCDNP